MIHLKYGIQFLFFISILSNSENALGQTSRCYMCMFDVYSNYSDESQKNDFDSLAILSHHKDSVRLLQRIIQHNCENKIGKKSLLIFDKIIEESFKAFNGEWTFEWSDSNWGTGSVRSDSIEEKIIITGRNIQIIRNDTIQNKFSEVLCLGLNYYKGTYLLIKIDDKLWKFSLEKEFNNRYASIAALQSLKLKNQFLYLREYGAACGGAELYYSKIE